MVCHGVILIKVVRMERQFVASFPDHLQGILIQGAVVGFQVNRAAGLKQLRIPSEEPGGGQSFFFPLPFVVADQERSTKFRTLHLYRRRY